MLGKGIISNVYDVNSFRVVFDGVINWPAHGLVIGTTYWNDELVPGGSNATKPSTGGSYVQETFMPIDDNNVLCGDQVTYAV